MSVKLKLITESAWLVLSDTDESRVGLLTEIQNKYVLMSKGVKQQFISRKAVNMFFEEDIFRNVIDNDIATNISKDYFIKGYPVDFDGPYEVLSKSSTLPLFSKKPSSEVYYSAGYYCLNFQKNWMPSFCPKLSTLESYEYTGPFHDEFTMKASLSKMRREKSNNV